MTESLSEVEPIGRTTRKFLEIAKDHEQKYLDFAAEQNKERGKVFQEWITDVVNILLDEIELTS